MPPGVSSDQIRLGQYGGERQPRTDLGWSPRSTLVFSVPAFKKIFPGANSLARNVRGRTQQLFSEQRSCNPAEQLICSHLYPVVSPAKYAILLARPGDPDNCRSPESRPSAIGE
jgi:hypothetical protein